MSEDMDKMIKLQESELVMQIDRLERGVELRDNQINSMKQMVIEVTSQLQESKMKKD